MLDFPRWKYVLVTVLLLAALLFALPNFFGEDPALQVVRRNHEAMDAAAQQAVENLIFKHPAVHQVALVAMPDPTFGEKACAFIVAKPGMTLRFDELIGFLKQQRIASFKLPERLEVVSDFPVSTFGKVSKKTLVEMVTKKLEQEAAAK